MCHDVSPKAGFSSDFRFSGGMDVPLIEKLRYDDVDFPHAS